MSAIPLRSSPIDSATCYPLRELCPEITTLHGKIGWSDFNEQVVTTLQALSLGRARNLVFLVSREANKFLNGYIIVSKEEDKAKAHVMLIAVDPKKQRSGIGYELMKAAIERISSVGIRTLTVYYEPEDPTATDFFTRKIPPYLSASEPSAITRSIEPFSDGRARSEITYAL